MKIEIILNDQKIIITESTIKKEMVRSLLTDLNPDEIDLLRGFAVQYLDNVDFIDPGCPLCGDIR